MGKSPLIPAPRQPADQATVRRLNLSLLLRALATGEPRSRARLATETSLNKATVSSLVTELMERRLVTEGPVQRSGAGRPGRIVQLDTGSIRCVGLEINVDYVVGAMTDLTGRVVARRRITAPMRELGPARGLSRAAELARGLLSDTGDRPDQVETVYISVPGLVDLEANSLTFAPNLHWRDADVAHTLRGRLGWPRARFHADNDANLAAMAAYSVGRCAGAANLLFVVGEIGIGAGIVIDGRIVRGGKGFAGEVGHMPLGPGDRRCDCGRTGCWETAVGLRALLTAIDPGAVGEFNSDLTDAASQVDGVRARAEAGDSRTLAVLDEMARWLGLGLSVLANVLDPQAIVLGGHFAALRRYLEPVVAQEISGRIVGQQSTIRLEFSEFGFDAPVIGAAHAGIDLILSDPTLVLPR